MSQVINTNIASLNAQRNLDTSQNSLRTSLQRLSSGLRINSAKDDAAGLAIAQRMTTQSRAMTVAMRNANDGISVAQTAEAGLASISDHLQRMRELATQAASGQYSSTDQAALNTEFQALNSEVTRVLGATAFNGQSLLVSSASSNYATTSGVAFQIGSTIVASDSQISLSTGSGLSAALSAGTLGSISSAGAASSAMSAIDAAIDNVNTSRASLGAIQSRFEGVLTQLSSSKENIEAAKSRIMDADYASETASLSRAQILQQAGTAMLAQANSMQNNVLSLLK